MTDTRANDLTESYYDEANSALDHGELAEKVKAFVTAFGGRISSSADESCVDLIATCLIMFYETHDIDGEKDLSYLRLIMAGIDHLLPRGIMGGKSGMALFFARDVLKERNEFLIVEAFEAIDSLIWAEYINTGS